MNTVSFLGNDHVNVNESAKESDTFTGINNSIFTMKIQQKKSHLIDESGHEVLFNVTFALAVPGVFTSARLHDSFSTRTSISDQTSRNIQQFFHLEFDLFSKEIIKESYKTDVGFYGTYAKIYPDKSESKVIPTWTDGEDTWISWIQQYKFWIIDCHIRDLCSHKMKLSIWDTKDKCLPKVRFDRPKPPKSASKSKSTNENVSWIKQTVLMISKDYSTTSAFKEDNDRILPHQIITSQQLKKNSIKPNLINKTPKHSSTTKSSGSSRDLKTKETESVVLYVEPKLDTNSTMESYGQLEKLLEPAHNTSAGKTKSDYFISNTKQQSILYSKVLDKAIESNFLTQSRKSIAIPIDNDNYNKNGRANIEINLADLFQKSHTLNRVNNSFNSFEDMFCQISIESDILSITQRKRLNPLVIKIKKLTNLPIKNQTINEINQKYKPVYFQYQFADLPIYKTLSRLHNNSIYFDDVSIVLLGDLSEVQIKEQFLNSFFILHLFNRIKHDSIPNSDSEEMIPHVKNNQNIGDINITSSVKMVTQSTTPKPQGESKIDLSEIVIKNLKFLEVSVPIVPISTLALKEDNENEIKREFEDVNNFIETETTIKISFQLSESLSINLNNNESSDYFTKIIVINTDIKCNFIKEKCSELILQYNCEKFNFENKEISEMQTFLYSIKNSSIEKTDILTGFFIIDSKSELLCIEGNQICIQNLYEKLSELLNNYHKQDPNLSHLKILYNDLLVFKDKEFSSIITMIPLILSKDIDFFASQPLLYVRDIVPKNCLEGICRLNNLLIAESMQIVIRNNLIPTSLMIEDLSNYLCSYIESKVDKPTSLKTKKHNTIKNSLKDFERKQIKTAPVIGERKPIEKDDKCRTKTQMSINYIVPEKSNEFSYSCQSKNSISSALKEIRNQMHPKRRYTYSQDYLFSGSLDPVDLEEFYLNEERKLKSESKWINKGQTTEIEDCALVNNLPDFRVKDLKEPWKENELHTTFMQPTLPERDSTEFKFDTYVRPLNLLDRNPTSIMPSYLVQKQDEKQKRQIDLNTWKNKICVSNLRFNVHRLLPKTELIEKGQKSSNQIAKLQGLRKDKLNIVNYVMKKYGDPNIIPAIGILPIEESQNLSLTVGPEINRNLSVNYTPISRKDKSFKSVYNSRKEIPIFKNRNLRKSYENLSPFSMSC